ncbi:MAG: TIM barrel protein [Rhodothermales bacterium]|nr:TIM barrel protein [Rhodothermales bacterium]
MALTRREFTKRALAGVPALAGLANGIGSGGFSPAGPNRSLIHGVQFGVQPFCYHDLLMNRENRPELLRRIVQNGFGMVELHATWCEPRFLAPGVTPAEARQKQREWRLAAPAEYYQAIRKEFDAAGVEIFTYYVNMDVSYQNAFIDFTDEEVDATFRAAKILGARGCIGSQGLKATQRLASFPSKYDLFMSVHNHSNLSDPDAINNEESFIRAFSYSPDIMATFDTRHYTAANGDCLAFLEKHHARISNVHLGDRKKNQGRSAPFGQGDAPIIELIRMIRDNAWPIPVMLEFEHGTLRTGLDETQRMFDYCKRALA